MSKPRKVSTNQLSNSLISEAFFFWVSVAIIGYAFVVPLLALESLFLAEWFMQFAVIQQAAIVLLIVLKSIDVFCNLIIKGWNASFIPTFLALGLLLFSVQPTANCCTILVAAIAGFASWSDLQPSEVVLHLLPIAGCSAILLEPHYANIKSKLSPSPMSR